MTPITAFKPVEHITNWSLMSVTVQQWVSYAVLVGGDLSTVEYGAAVSTRPE